MILSKQQIEYYKNNGHLKIKNIFSKKSLKMLINYVDEIERFKPQKNKYMIYFDKVSGVMCKTRTENFLKYHKKFDLFLKKNKVHKIVDQVLGKKSIIFKDKINWKYPNAKGFEPHQDAQVWEYLYPRIKTFVSLTISIDETNKRNGSLELVSKMNKKGLLGNNKKAINSKLVKKMKWKRVDTKPGDIIIFDSYTPHRSKKNLTKKPRRMIYFTYNAKKDGNLRNEYYFNKRKSFPPNIERNSKKKYKYLI